MRICFRKPWEVLKTRALYKGIDLIIGDPFKFEFTEEVFGAIIQYTDTNGKLKDFSAFINNAHENGSVVAMAADVLSLTLLKSPGELDIDIAFGSTQRFGIPMGYGGPHAAYFAVKDSFKRNIPGRIIGVSVDKQGNTALRMALQTREQHIKRERATSNICTAQALLATMAGMYAVYHGPEGLKAIAKDIHSKAVFLSKELEKIGYKQINNHFFDTLNLELPAGVYMSELKSAWKKCKLTSIMWMISISP
jgi:glycine dehydrogenase